MPIAGEGYMLCDSNSERHIYRHRIKISGCQGLAGGSEECVGEVGDHEGGKSVLCDTKWWPQEQQLKQCI